MALPILIVGAEQLQGSPAGRFLLAAAGPQSIRPHHAHPISDLFGVAGVSFLVAMVNGLLVDTIVVVRHRRSGQPAPVRTLAIGVAITVIALVATIGYGRWRIGQTAQFVSQGPAGRGGRNRMCLSRSSRASAPAGSSSMS